MSVVIRLARAGTKKRPVYHVVVAGICIAAAYLGLQAPRHSSLRHHAAWRPAPRMRPQKSEPLKAKP